MEPTEPAPEPEPAALEPAEPVAEPPSADFLEITLNNAPLSLPLSEKQQTYFIMNLLERAGVDPSNPQGTLVMECDGAPVGFLHRLQAGAQVRIGWK